MMPYRALEQIEEIHSHLARTEVYRGYRSIPVGLTGAAAALAAIFQPHFIVAAPRRFVLYWLGVAAFNVLLTAVAVFWNHAVRSTERERRRSLHVVGLFMPSLVGGFLVTWAILFTFPGAIPLLPGLWAVMLSLGMFATRPYLPHATGWVALFYLVAGAHLLTLAGSGASLHPWAMGGTFAVGQSLTSAVLYWNLERKDA